MTEYQSLAIVSAAWLLAGIEAGILLTRWMGRKR